MKVTRFIVIPVYDHTDDQEMREIMDDLDRLGFAKQPYLAAAEKLPAPWPWENHANVG